MKDFWNHLDIDGGLTMEKKAITRTEAAEILGCKYQGVVQYINKKQLDEAPADPITGDKRVWLDQVAALRTKRKERAEKIRNKRLGYSGGLPCPFDVRVVLDPDDDSGLCHEWFISKQAFDDLNTGVRSWNEIHADEIYYERVGGRLPMPKHRD